MRKSLFIPVFGLFVLIAACQAGGPSFSDEEKALINGSETTMRVLTVDDSTDIQILRKSCIDIPVELLSTEEYLKLQELLVSTVTSPDQDGVGIAGPQVGINRRIIAVQRLDKDGEPFEVYPNIRITERRGDLEAGAEGCLSVPGFRGQVMRWRDIDICYSLSESGKDTTETIQGFTAVIFQHECDHLDGVLYTDKATEITKE